MANIAFMKWATENGYNSTVLADPATLKEAKERFEAYQKGGTKSAAPPKHKRLCVTLVHGSETLHTFVTEGLSTRGRGGLSEAAQTSAEMWLIENGHMEKMAEVQIGIAELKFLSE